LSVCQPFLLDFAGKRIIQAYGSLADVHIPWTVKILSESAFSGSIYLNSVCIPSDVETTATGCFSGLRLASLTFQSGSKLAVIDREAFWSCEALTSFHIPALVEMIGGSAFTFTRISTITIDPTNSRFSVSAPFLMDFAEFRSFVISGLR
jgi:hypothetical protein